MGMKKYNQTDTTVTWIVVQRAVCPIAEISQESVTRRKMIAKVMNESGYRNIRLVNGWKNEGMILNYIYHQSVKNDHSETPGLKLVMWSLVISSSRKKLLKQFLRWFSDFKNLQKSSFREMSAFILLGGNVLVICTPKVKLQHTLWRQETENTAYFGLMIIAFEISVLLSFCRVFKIIVMIIWNNPLLYWWHNFRFLCLDGYILCTMSWL